MQILKYKDKLPQIAENVFGFETTIVIGDVRISENVFLLPNVSIRGDMNHISIDSFTNIQDGTVIHTDWTYPAIIGKRVTVGHNAILHGCEICDDVLIGMGSIILNGAYIPSNVIIAAGSLVGQNKKLESGWLYAGIPAKKVRQLTDEDLTYIEKAYKAYIELMNGYNSKQ
jgi:carbonic anhydrase/acetyltransferase-like protein (isoleucine patch superfamily)